MNLLTKCLHEELRLRLQNFILPKKFNDYTIDELIEQVRSFLHRKVNVKIERVRLHHRKQQPDESVQLYFNGLKQMAFNCQFTAVEYDDRLCDIFFVGLRQRSDVAKVL